MSCSWNSFAELARDKRALEIHLPWLQVPPVQVCPERISLSHTFTSTGTQSLICSATRMRSSSKAPPGHTCAVAGRLAPPCRLLALQLTMTYTGGALGIHSLPVQLHITDGRRLRLDLIGACVPDATQLAHLPGASAPGGNGTLQLRPVRVASHRPPLQMFRFQNAGPATMHWRLDLSPLQALKQKSFG